MKKDKKALIEKLRLEMHKIIITEGGLTNEKVIIKSKELDKLLNEYEYKKYNKVT